MLNKIKKSIFLILVAALSFGVSEVFADENKLSETQIEYGTQEYTESQEETVSCAADAEVSGDTYVSEESVATVALFDSESSDAPELQSVGVVKDGIQIKWDAVSDAVAYQILRMGEGDSSFKKIHDTSNDDNPTVTSYTDTTAKTGETYYYTVRAVYGNGSTGSYNSDGKFIKYLKAFTIDSVTNTASGVKISWTPNDNARKYRIYRKSKGDEWERLAETTGKSYTDTTVDSGTTYYYAVRILDSQLQVASYYVKKSIYYISAPFLNKAAPAKSGIKVSWEYVEGATKYRVYRKVGEGKWKKLGETAEKEYTDTSAKTGTEYIYTVRAVKGDYVSGYSSDGVTLDYLAAPTLSSVANKSTGVKVSWGKVSGASKYRVYRKTSKKGTWKKLADTTGTSYTDKSAKSGKTYYYTVRAINGAGVVASYYDTKGLSVKCLALAKIKSVSANKLSVKVTWSKVSGASGYYIYRKTGSSGSWKKIKTVKSGSTTSYTDKSGKYDTTYYYTVRAYSGSTKGGYKSSDAVRLFSAPTVTLSNTKTGVKVSWTKKSKAEGYYVYRKASTEKSWTKIKKITGGSTLTYTDTSVSATKKYYYTVRAYSSTSKGNYKSSDVIKYLKVPTLSAISNTNSGIKVTWEKVSGASKYYVYRKTSSSSWTKIKETTNTYYTDKTASSGTTYYYTVRGVSGSSKSYYNTSGISLMRLSSPTLKSAEYSETDNSVTVKWSAVTGASGYYIYRKESGGDWTKIASATGTSYKDATGEDGTIYSYTVRAYNGDTKSSYDSSGITAVFGGTFGIDVSDWNGKIDWKKAKADGVQFAIIRIGWGSDYSNGSQDDAYAEYNMTQCEKYDIPYGVYIFSYAVESSQAKSEAKHTIRMIGNHKPTLGVWYDVEDETKGNTTYYNQRGFYPETNSGDAEKLTGFCTTFIKQIKAAGYDRVGVYSYKNYFKTAVNFATVAKAGYIWYAYWNVSAPDKDCNIWQYSATGSVNGISGNVDMDILFRF